MNKKEEKNIEVNEKECDCQHSWASQYRTVYIGGAYGYRYGCADIVECPCGHIAVREYRYYD